eukprot:364334-Chlamydomonas_euryale.AAC.10
MSCCRSDFSEGTVRVLNLPNNLVAGPFDYLMRLLEPLGCSLDSLFLQRNSIGSFLPVRAACTLAQMSEGRDGVRSMCARVEGARPPGCGPACEHSCKHGCYYARLHKFT